MPTHIWTQITGAAWRFHPSIAVRCTYAFNEEYLRGMLTVRGCHNLLSCGGGTKVNTWPILEYISYHRGKISVSTVKIEKKHELFIRHAEFSSKFHKKSISKSNHILRCPPLKARGFGKICCFFKYFRIILYFGLILYVFRKLCNPGCLVVIVLRRISHYTYYLHHFCTLKN
jgi:hypothetical protein